MMELGTVLSIAQTLLAALQCSELKDFCSTLGYQSELENLEHTVNTIKAVLLDAESKQVQADLSHQAQLWFDDLKDAIYDADDLLDEFATLAQQKKLMKGGYVSKKVRLLFSRFNSLAVSHRMSRGVKEITKRLNAIANNHNQFGFKLDFQPIRRRRDETCSYVYAQDIIGRENDIEQIVGRLLHPDVQQEVSCLTIVGIGGLGKTALAQLVYNDLRIKERFPLRLWTCVSDEDPKYLDIKSILLKILQSATHLRDEVLNMDHLQNELQEKLAAQKFLLVLDDVWNEDNYQWRKLLEFLMVGPTGSWILVTTRSRITASMGDGHTYDLKGLSEEDSWRLFERVAFSQRHKLANSIELVEIGQKIVKRCANVPLAIRVVGSLLYGHGKDNWLLFEKIALGRIRLGENGGIEPILKLSYQNLESPLKTCFVYCALFPKDFVIDKEKLISLWIAQGYIVPLVEGQSLEDAAEDYFLILLRRCFYQDVKKDKHGKIISCKIHDLMHDIAQQVAGKEAYASTSIRSNLDKKFRHLCDLGMGEVTENNFSGGKIRTYVRVGQMMQLPVGTFLANWKYLRALDLSDLRLKILPNTIGNLLHLRYLDLSRNHDLEVLPGSICKLHNLQTLKLQWCEALEELPKNLSKLVNLRVLDITHCRRLTHMPSGMGKMSYLWKLPIYVVGDTKTSQKQGVVNQLEELKALVNLKGHLKIRISIPEDATYVKENGEKTRCLSKDLNHIVIKFLWGGDEINQIVEYDEALLEGLQPHSNLNRLDVSNYGGKRMPSWASGDNLTSFLPNLVVIRLQLCDRLQHLAPMGELPHLKALEVLGLINLEYMENRTRGSCGHNIVASRSKSFFPSLVKLDLWDLPSLKGWWREDDMIDNTTSEQEDFPLPSFPRLSHLYVWGCWKLTCIPLCPSLETLILEECDERLRIMLESPCVNFKE